jgi:CRISPR/Cas system CSM-associated protein Csm3 (group 7 of RAMP superfamily)
MQYEGVWRVARNEVIVPITVRPSSPLLIQAPKKEEEEKEKQNGTEEKNNTIECLSYQKNGTTVYYIPGSSLKGVLRAHTEKIFWHLFSERVSEKMPKEEFKKVEEKSRFYRELDYISQLFGHPKFRGRFTVDDAYFVNLSSSDIDKRTNIAIDRFRGGSKNGALFTVESIVSGEAKTHVRLKNPEIWQISWLCFLLRDWKEGRITVGAKSAVGFGRLDIDIHALEIHMYDRSLEQMWQENGIFQNSETEQELYRIYRFQQLDDLAQNVEPAWVEWMKEGGRR